MHSIDTPSQILPTLKPDIIGALVPSDAAEQKSAFLSGAIRNPKHDYVKLNRDHSLILQEIVSEGERAIGELGDTSKKFEPAYAECIESYVETEELMWLMRLYNEATDPDKKAELRKQIEYLNIETYGEPDSENHQHILASYRDKIDAAADTFSDNKSQIYQELLGGLPSLESAVDPGSYEPKPETVAWMQQIVENLYGNMTAHVEDDRTYNPYELQALFTTIIRTEFGDEVADVWRVDVEEANSITVKATECRIVIPVNRKEATSEQAKDLVVHEIGVHMLRAVCGYDTDVPLLATGLAHYIDSEEGLAVAMEQARKGKFVEAGHGLYLVASLAHLEGLDFRGVFEVMWRILYLVSPNESDAEINRFKDVAYNLCMRVFRGTDDLPWFKDLQYYTGARSVWKVLDGISGDTTQVSLMLMGKTNITDSDQRQVVLESSSK